MDIFQLVGVVLLALCISYVGYKVGYDKGRNDERNGIQDKGWGA